MITLRHAWRNNRRSSLYNIHMQEHVKERIRKRRFYRCLVANKSVSRVRSFAPNVSGRCDGSGEEGRGDIRGRVALVIVVKKCTVYIAVCWWMTISRSNVSIGPSYQRTHFSRCRRVPTAIAWVYVTYNWRERVEVRV